MASAEGVIAATPEEVWLVLSDIESWPRWNPDVKDVRVDGPLAPGTHFVWKAGPGTIRSELQVVQPPNRIGWTGKTMGIDAVHVWEIEAVDGGSRVRTEESWSGIIVRLFAPMMKGQLQKAMDGGLRHLRAALHQREG